MRPVKSVRDPSPGYQGSLSRKPGMYDPTARLGKAFVAVWIGFLLINLAIWAAVIFVAVHFLEKVW